ncbi:MAG TPA: ABC transporter ATP-binding protein, partial [Candidatus Acidoferrum sp.]|nr:ABC transporter ATP-binding protein [Candidatus Acidoferrum sp.]
MVEVRAENVRKMYGKVEALKGVSLNFKSGGLTAILGPSGCGKTTLLRSIAGFIEVDAGRIFFDAEDVTSLPPQRRGTAMVFQNYALWPHMTIFENVSYGLRLKKVPAAEVRRRVLQVLQLVEIGNLADVESRKPSALSGGQQQRVALARALVVEPKVLLMDEPLSNLDAKVRQRLRAELRRLQKQVGITAIYVTHDQEEALALADTVVLMDQGTIVQTGTPQQMYLKP